MISLDLTDCRLRETCANVCTLLFLRQIYCIQFNTLLKICSTNAIVIFALLNNASMQINFIVYCTPTLNMLDDNLIALFFIIAHCGSTLIKQPLLFLCPSFFSLFRLPFFLFFFFFPLSVLTQTASKEGAGVRSRYTSTPGYIY